MATCGRRPSRRLDLGVIALAIAACDEPGAEPPDNEPTQSITLPDDEACDDIRQWPKARRERESQMLDAIARVRSEGGTCPDARRFAAGNTAATEGALVCAARNFTLYLEEYDVLGHDDGDGDTVVDRLADAGWDTLLATQLVAAGDIAPDRIVDEVWLPSGPHCDALRAKAWTHVGVGWIENEVPVDPSPDDPMLYGGYWVVVLSTGER